LFNGPHGAPTLEGQYVLKDVILIAAGFVIAATSFRGGRLIRRDLPPASPASPGSPLDGEQELRLVLDGDGDPRRARELFEQLGISEADLDDWRHVARQAAARALDEHAEHTTRNGHHRDDGYPRDVLHQQPPPPAQARDEG